jgi:hypothetical protein
MQSVCAANCAGYSESTTSVPSKHANQAYQQQLDGTSGAKLSQLQTWISRSMKTVPRALDCMPNDCKLIPQVSPSIHFSFN